MTNTQTVDINEYRSRKENTTSSSILDHERFMSFIQAAQDLFSDKYKYVGYTESIRGDMEQAVTLEGSSMDWQERYIDKLDRDVSDMKSSLRATEERIAGMINQTLGEMRDRDNQRIADVRDIRSDIRDIRNLFTEERRWIIAMAITTIIGVAAMVVTVLIRG